MSKSAYSYFHYLCSLSYRTIHRAHPVTTILGTHLPPPSGNVHRSLGYHRSYASTALIGGDMKRNYEVRGLLVPPVILGLILREGYPSTAAGL